MANRPDLGRRIFENMQEDGVAVQPRLWCFMISLAAKAHDAAFAEQCFRAASAHKPLPVEVYNSMLQVWLLLPRTARIRSCLQHSVCSYMRYTCFERGNAAII